MRELLNRIAAWRGYPAKIRMDNGPEFIAIVLAEWVEDNDVELTFIQPGRPMQNGFTLQRQLTQRRPGHVCLQDTKRSARAH